MNRAVVNECAAVKLQAERRAGELLAAMDLKPGKKRIGNTMLSISELGIHPMKSHRWQLMATVPEDEFRAEICE